MTADGAQAARLQSRGLDTLARFQALTERCRVPCFLMFGTLLGHVRERGFIAGDHDIDLAMSEAHADTLEPLMRACAAAGFTLRLEFGFAGRACQVSFREPGSGLSVDVYVVSDDGERSLLHEYSSARQQLRRYSYPPATFSQLQAARFSGQVGVLVPVPSEPILEMTYGDWRRPCPQFSPARDYRNAADEPLSVIDPRLEYRNFDAVR